MRKNDVLAAWRGCTARGGAKLKASTEHARSSDAANRDAILWRRHTIFHGTRSPPSSVVEVKARGGTYFDERATWSARGARLSPCAERPLRVDVPSTAVLSRKCGRPEAPRGHGAARRNCVPGTVQYSTVTTRVLCLLHRNKKARAPRRHSPWRRTEQHMRQPRNSPPPCVLVSVPPAAHSAHSARRALAPVNVRSALSRLDAPVDSRRPYRLPLKVGPALSRRAWGSSPVEAAARGMDEPAPYDYGAGTSSIGSHALPVNRVAAGTNLRVPAPPLPGRQPFSAERLRELMPSPPPKIERAHADDHSFTATLGGLYSPGGRPARLPALPPGDTLSTLRLPPQTLLIPPAHMPTSLNHSRIRHHSKLSATSVALADACDRGHVVPILPRPSSPQSAEADSTEPFRARDAAAKDGPRDASASATHYSRNDTPSAYSRRVTFGDGCARKATRIDAGCWSPGAHTHTFLKCRRPHPCARSGPAMQAGRIFPRDRPRCGLRDRRARVLYRSRHRTNDGLGGRSDVCTTPASGRA